MLKFDETNKSFQKIDATELKTENVLERYDLQHTIIKDWELFKNEIGLPSAFLIGDEINPHPSTQNSIDLLAYNPDDSSLIVIELKRDRHKFHLLQALSYAAMVNSWDSETLISKIKKSSNPDPQELIDLITSNEINSDVKIILIAEYYDPEVIITSDWLSSNYSVDITAYAIALHKMGVEKFMTLEQRYPLKDLADTYEVRSRRKQNRKKQDDITWEEVLPKLEYPFAKKGVELCSHIRPGEPSRRRFGSIRTDFDGFTWISINFRRKYINVYIKGDFDNAQDHILSKFEEAVSISTWRDGFSFIVETEKQFNDLVKWLKLES
jgi:hypothetical protein